MAQPANILRQKRFTARDLWRMPDDGNRYEIIDGEVFVTPAPYVSHQEVLANLNDVLRHHVRRHRLGLLLFAPVGVVLEPLSGVEPDLIFVAHARRAIVQSKGIFGPPDLAAEILSPSTAARDRGRKKALYARTGVAHYWMVDPRAGTLVALRLQGDAYAVEAEVGPRGTFKPSLFPGLAIRMRDLLRRTTD
ncbi:Uma2 family endonuclease [bacterium]|nr:Uma2 family endonuclease [bacterium]